MTGRMRSRRGLSVAIAHDYVTQRGGAERVVLAMLRAFPEAPLYTLLYEPDDTFPEFRDASIVTSPLNRVGPLRRSHRAALPLLPIASRRLRVEADVVLASSSGWAHGFDIPGRSVVYCHAPARWLHQRDEYLGDAGRWDPKRVGLSLMTPALRRFDRRSAAAADTYLANSRVVSARIREAYGREAEVVAPPYGVDTSGPQEMPPSLQDWADGYHLIVSRLLPYKNVDRAVTAFASLPDQRLLVVGAGPESDRLHAMAGRNVKLLENLADAELRWVYAHATALVAPSLEDFGLTPLEAAAFGKPTIALRAGGYLDTVDEAVNGAFFETPTAGAISAAVAAAKDRSWDPASIRGHADGFSEDRFARRLREIVLGEGR